MPLSTFMRLQKIQEKLSIEFKIGKTKGEEEVLEEIEAEEEALAKAQGIKRVSKVYYSTFLELEGDAR